MNKSQMLHYRHFVSMTVRLIILVSIFILVSPISVRADNATRTPNSYSYDTSDSSPIPAPAVNADDTTYDAYQVPATKNESTYQVFYFDFPVITGTINSFSDLPTLEIRFLGWVGNSEVAYTDFVKLYVSWGGEDPTPLPGNATGSVTVDGRLKLEEEPYSYYKRITHPQTPGDLYFYHDETGRMCYYLLEVDRDFNDNVFSGGQGTYLQSDEWNQGHDFFALWESDAARFTIYDLGSVLYDFYLGYVGDDGTNWVSGLDDVEGSVTTDACITVTLTSSLVSATSLEWDLENSIHASTWSPPYNNDWESPALDYSYTNGQGDYWEFRMIYELGFQDDCGCGDADVADAHNSPSKDAQSDPP